MSHTDSVAGQSCLVGLSRKSTPGWVCKRLKETLESGHRALEVSAEPSYMQRPRTSWLKF